MVSPKNLATVVACCGALVACTADRTEIIVAVGTDLPVPSQIDEIRIDVVGPSSTMPKSSTARLGPGEPPPPRTLGLVHEDGPLGPFFVRVAGRLGGGDVIERRARVSFIEGRTLLLRMDLLGRCLGVTCDASTTCAESGCRSIDVAAESLPEWTGTVPGGDAGPAVDAGRRDAARPDSGPCTPAGEECNSVDDDCDGVIDEDFDLATDADHCGACGNRCGVPARDCCSGTCGRC